MCLWEDRENRKNNFTKEKRESLKLKRLDIPRLGGVSLKMKDEDMGLAWVTLARHFGIVSVRLSLGGDYHPFKGRTLCLY